MPEAQPDSQPNAKPPEHKSFWSTLPGILTAAGGVIAAVGTLITALATAGVLNREKPTVVPTATPIPAITATFTPAPATSTVVLPAPTQPAPTATALPGGLLFEDDFSAPRNGWLTEIAPEAEKAYEAGEFRIALYQREFSAWTFPQPPRDLADFAIEVDARRVSGPSDNEFGVLTRYQDATDEFYLFAISSDGTYAVQKYRGDKWYHLAQWTASDAVKQGEAVNRLRVTCQGSKLRFYVNGESLVQVEDASFRAGSIGLLASSGDRGGVVIAFDNLRVHALTGQ